MAGGYDIGASFSGSSSAGASQSGATDLSGGGNYGGQSYGPGSVVNGAVQTPLSKISWWIAAIVGLVLLAPFFFKRKGGK